jgi:hypothetical protein
MTETNRSGSDEPHRQIENITGSQEEATGGDPLEDVPDPHRIAPLPEHVIEVDLGELDLRRMIGESPMVNPDSEP